MPEQTTQIAKFLAPLCAFAGAVIMLVFRREMQMSRVFVAIVGGPLFAGLLAPSIDAYLRTTYKWLPDGFSVQGAIGCLIGMLALYMVSAVDKFGQRAEETPINLPKGERNGN